MIAGKKTRSLYHAIVGLRFRRSACLITLIWTVIVREGPSFTFS